MIVLVHGIGQQVSGAFSLASQWKPALQDGLAHAGADPHWADGLRVASYGDLFRKSGVKSALPDPPFDAADVEDGYERELLEAWWSDTAPAQGAPATRTRTPVTVQRMLDRLSQVRFFAGLAERALISDLKQVSRYFRDEAVRTEAQQRVAACVDAETRVLIGHSLGSVVAYEALARHPEWKVKVFVSLGSPLGIRNLIFDRLRPAPTNGLGAWPGSVAEWINIADEADVVALVKDLARCFGPRVVDRRVHNDAHAHDAQPYLTARETGEAIARAF